jgi:hypothetical protein
MSSPFAVTTPSTTVYLAQNRVGRMPFTITNMTDQTLQGQVTVVPLDGAPPEWFKPDKKVVNLNPHASDQVKVQVEPPLGAVAATQLFRLDVDDPTTAEPAIVGPSVSVVVPPSQATFSWKTPRGYLATLVGASAGGALGELIIFLMFLRGPTAKECGSDLGCALGNAFTEIIFLLLGILLGLALLWLGAVEGAWIGLRVREYLGSKLTALFLAVLMVPWTILMLWALSKITNSLALLMILAPILLTAVPGLVARGSVLLIRTKHL